MLRSDSPPAEKAIACKHLAIYGSQRRGARAGQAVWPTNSWPRGRGSRWKRFPARKPTRPCARRSIRSRAGCWSARSIRSAFAAMPTPSSRWPAQLKDRGCRRRFRRRRRPGTHRQRRRDQDASRNRWPRSPAKVRSAVAEGCILCAERLLAEGNGQEAAEIYDEVRKADVPKQQNPGSDPRRDSGPQDRRHSAVGRAAPLVRTRRCSRSA